MKIKAKYLYITLASLSAIVILLTGILVASWVFHWESPREKELKKQGDEIVVKIESFRVQHGRLPENLREMGLPESEEGPLYYNKRKDGKNYTVSFSGSTLGESTYYDSEDKLWHDF